MELLEPVTQPYAWGSHTAIAELQGRPAPTAEPEAELWMGAHPSAPSGVALDGGGHTTLDALIAADPVRELGRESVERFGRRLPFLLKVLAAETALSIQVHPSREQAEAGFLAENERGLAPGDKSRNYADDWPKPEILCALTPFEAFAGMRAPQDAVALLKELGVGALDPIAAILAAASGPEALTEALAAILAWPPDRRAALIAAVVRGCADVAAAGGPYAAACAAAVRISGEHQGDLGVVASLLLRHAVLRPGQAVFLPAGGLHTYLHGTGVELLANSDNVVRAGLTPKHIDVPELLALTDPAVPVPVLDPRPLGGGLFVYDSPAPEFRLYRAELGDGELPLPGPGGARIVLCTEGAASLRPLVAPAGAAGVTVGRGQSCFVAAGDGQVAASGPATLFIAASGLGPMPRA
ncbi:MAG TPA: mannose-6-phosphate isomerase, class I [Trebonia sp.]|jgi:mannose-6-phosphate isomerase|nr:mannose-6-phosphate isomerase, class I [Trebonia sp.]